MPPVKATHPSSHRPATARLNPPREQQFETGSNVQVTGPNYSGLRANPFPEVTDLFCRLPLPTLFYQLEAVHLGDLMRLCVRPRVQ